MRGSLQYISWMCLSFFVSKQPSFYLLKLARTARCSCCQASEYHATDHTTPANLLIALYMYAFPGALCSSQYSQTSRVLRAKHYGPFFFESRTPILEVWLARGTMQLANWVHCR